MRVAAATNKSLESCIKERPFREDLYYRLNVVHIHKPSRCSGRYRGIGLANHFLSKYCKMMNTELKQFTAPALEELSSYSWPGNARQLENEIKRLVASVRGKSITEDHLDGSIRNRSGSIQSFQPKEEPAVKSPTSRSLPDAVDQLERRLIEEALRNSGGNKQKAAQTLGLSRQGLIKKLKRLGIADRQLF